MTTVTCGSWTSIRRDECNAESQGDMVKAVTHDGSRGLYRCTQGHGVCVQAGILGWKKLLIVVIKRRKEIYMKKWLHDQLRMSRRGPVLGMCHVATVELVFTGWILPQTTAKAKQGDCQLLLWVFGMWVMLIVSGFSSTVCRFPGT